MPPERRKTPDDEWRPYVQALGRRIAALRKARGWSQMAFAEQAGLAVNSVKLIEVGKSSWEGENSNLANPTLDTLTLMATALDITVAELLAPLPAPSKGLARARHALVRRVKVSRTS